MRKVLARGRVLGNSNSEFARMLESDGDVKTFTLKSGKQAKFVKTVVLSGEIESKTFVDSSVKVATRQCYPLSQSVTFPVP